MENEKDIENKEINNYEFTNPITLKYWTPDGEVKKTLKINKNYMHKKDILDFEDLLFYTKGNCLELISSPIYYSIYMRKAEMDKQLMNSMEKLRKYDGEITNEIIDRKHNLFLRGIHLTYNSKKQKWEFKRDKKGIIVADQCWKMHIPQPPGFYIFVENLGKEYDMFIDTLYGIKNAKKFIKNYIPLHQIKFFRGTGESLVFVGDSKNFLSGNIGRGINLTWGDPTQMKFYFRIIQSSNISLNRLKKESKIKYYQNKLMFYDNKLDELINKV